MIKLTFDDAAANELTKLMKGVEKDVRKQLKTAVNKAGRSMESQMARMVRQEINVASKAVKRVITRPLLATETQLSTEIVVAKGKRLSLKEFGARQTKAGVSYRISKKGGKKTIKGGFIVESLGGHVYVRDGDKVEMSRGRYKGRKRQKIFKRFGPSLWGYFANRKVMLDVQKKADAELEKQVKERIRFLTLKAEGKLKGK